MGLLHLSILHLSWGASGLEESDQALDSWGIWEKIETRMEAAGTKMVGMCLVVRLLGCNLGM